MTGLALLLVMQAASTGSVDAPQPARAVSDYPFAIGERLEYDAKLGMIKLGDGHMLVSGLDTLRGVETFRFEFALEGGGLGFTLKDKLESWTTTSDFVSLRMRKELDEGDDLRIRTYEIYPDSGFYREVGKETTRATPRAPLDDAAFFYFMRVTPLIVGKTYTFKRYFDDAKNPLTVKVEKREEMKLPDGRKVMCLVLHPVIGDRGMFAERARARIWLTDDALRIPVQIRSSFPFGTMTLKLRDMTLGPRQG